MEDFPNVEIFHLKPRKFYTSLVNNFFSSVNKDNFSSSFDRSFISLNDPNSSSIVRFFGRQHCSQKISFVLYAQAPTFFLPPVFFILKNQKI